MASGSNEKHENANSPINGHQPSIDDVYKTPRHPRWTRQETLVLIEGKRLAEERGKKGRKPSSVNVEPKWDFVSSHCRQNGVSRGPVQCRKRWSNLLSDFKKIKAWDSQVQGEGESFWMMRSDLRRERRLPGFFDREVYDVLVGKVLSNTTPEIHQLALVTISVEEDNGDGADDDEDEMVEDEENRDDLFSEYEQDDDAHEEVRRNLGKEKVETDDETDDIPSPVPISEMKYRAFHQAYSNQERKRQPGSQFWRNSEFGEGVKRRRRQFSSKCQNADADDSLIKALEMNRQLLNAHLEEEKMNRRLDREQRKEQHDSLMAALSKITEALEKIANKL